MEELKMRVLGLAPLKDEHLEALISEVKPATLAPGEVLGRDDVAYIQKGLMRAYYRQEDGKDLLREFAKEDDLICYLTLWQTSETEDLVIEAIEETQIYKMSQKALDEFYKLDPACEEFGRKIMEEAYMKKCRRERQLLSTTLAGRYKQFKEDYPGLESRLNQHYIASFLGVSPVSLSRHRGDLNNKG